MKNLQKILLQLLISTLVLLNTDILATTWDSTMLLRDGSSYDFKKTKRVQFISLKKKYMGLVKTGWCSEEKIDLLFDLTLLTQPNVCVDIGSFTGSSVIPVAATLKLLGAGKVYAIDAWSNAEAIKGIDTDDPNYTWWATLDLNSIQHTFLNQLKIYSLISICTIIPLPSREAIKQISTIDFLHLDGNFSEEGSLEDVLLYLPKVKVGGYVLLSNLFHMSKGRQPKTKAFYELFEKCDLIGEVDKGNTVLFRKFKSNLKGNAL